MGTDIAFSSADAGIVGAGYIGQAFKNALGEESYP